MTTELYWDCYHVVEFIPFYDLVLMIQIDDNVRRTTELNVHILWYYLEHNTNAHR